MTIDDLSGLLLVLVFLTLLLDLSMWKGEHLDGRRIPLLQVLFLLVNRLGPLDVSGLQVKNFGELSMALIVSTYKVQSLRSLLVVREVRRKEQGNF